MTYCPACDDHVGREHPLPVIDPNYPHTFTHNPAAIDAVEEGVSR